MSSTELLPRKAAEFSDPSYWKAFFAARKTPFEWYGDFDSLGSTLEKYLKANDTILQIGCGNSQLASQLHDSGFRSITSIDVEEKVIAAQANANQGREGLVFLQGDATKLSFPDSSFSAVLDKGTLDALLPPDADEQQRQTVRDMFESVQRVMQSNGRYIIITLAQPHIAEFWLDHFSKSNQYLLRAHKVENRASGFPMPVFLLVATKFRAAMPMALPIEFVTAMSAAPQRIAGKEDFMELLFAEQELAQFIHLCASPLSREVFITVGCEDAEKGPRYTIFLIDAPQTKRIVSFKAFVVPVGRDGDWMYATEKGRRMLRRELNVDRLAVVHLSRKHTFKDLVHVKDEIGSFIAKLDPRSYENNNVIEFLSIGSVDAKRVLAEGNSELNGKWSVEEVHINGYDLRRLVFLGAQNLVQSEAFLTPGKKGKIIVNLDELSCDHHYFMMAGLHLIPASPLTKPDQAQLRLAVYGLGGGLLAAFLVRHLPKSLLVAVELDPQVVKIATQYFSFPSSDPRVAVKTLDAMLFIREAAEAADKFDAVLMDLAGSMHDNGLSCPPAPFVKDEVFDNIKKSLKPHGLFAMNLVTRDDEISNEVKETISRHFESVYHISSDEDVNEVLLCFPSAISWDKPKAMRAFRKDLKWLEPINKFASKIEKIPAAK